MAAVVENPRLSTNAACSAEAGLLARSLRETGFAIVTGAPAMPWHRLAEAACTSWTGSWSRVPGVVARCLADQGRLVLDSPDKALPTLVLALLPAGFRGLVVAGLLAALTSSLASVLNSCATLVTMDLYRKLRPAAAEKVLVRVGQLTTVPLVALGIAWMPLMKLISAQIYQYLPSEEHLRGLTFGARRAAPLEPRSPHFAVTAGLSALLLATVAGVWLYFR